MHLIIFLPVGTHIIKFPETDCHCGGSGRSATGLLQIHVGFTQSESPKQIPISYILLDTCSTGSVGVNLNMVGTA